MATSGSTDFDLDVAEIIEEAYERCGLEVRTGYDIKTARRSMNLMFADWANRGLNLWTVKQATLSLTAGTATYTLDPSYTDLLEVSLRRSGTDFELSKMSRGEYLGLPNKTTQGRPSQYFYNRQTTPQITLWATPENSTDTLIYYYVKRIEDVDTFTNTTDAPFRFLPCIVAGLAYYLSMKKAPQLVQQNKLVYEDELKRALDEDGQRASTFIAPQTFYPTVS